MAAGIQFNAIAYKGGAAALQDVLGGQVDMLADSSSWAPHVEAGKLRLLATWGEERTPRFKDTPTLKELGYNVVVDAPNGIGAPKPACRPRREEAARRLPRRRPAKSSSRWPTASMRRCMYLDGPDYQKYVAAVYERETS
jgi:tripartite-type tricarboxylate transporter receptor subunit TctC